MVRHCHPTERRTPAQRRWTRSLLAPIVALSIVGGAIPRPAAAQFGPDAGEVERLYVEGQERVEAKDYTGAADSWTRLLSILPESGDNQAIRESVIINVLDAHLKGYNQLVDGKGSKDVSHLRTGKATLDKYYADFKGVHGDRVAVSAGVQEKAAELEATLAQAEEDAAALPPEPEGDNDPSKAVEPEPKPDDGPDVIVLNAQNNGTGLIVGGAVVGLLGLGAIAMIPIGSFRGKDADERDKKAKETNDTLEIERADFDGKQANAILISGAVLAPLLLGGAAAMIVFGFKARRLSKENQRKALKVDVVSPQLDRDYAGVGVRGRF